MYYSHSTYSVSIGNHFEVFVCYVKIFFCYVRNLNDEVGIVFPFLGCTVNNGFTFKVLTSSWSDGSMGPLAFTIPEGCAKQADIVRFNEAYAGKAMVISSGTNSHFMTAQTLIQVLEQLVSPALEIQRARTDGVALTNQLVWSLRYIFLCVLKNKHSTNIACENPTGPILFSTIVHFGVSCCKKTFIKFHEIRFDFIFLRTYGNITKNIFDKHILFNILMYVMYVYIYSIVM